MIVTFTSTFLGQCLLSSAISEGRYEIDVEKVGYPENPDLKFRPFNDCHLLTIRSFFFARL